MSSNLVVLTIANFVKIFAIFRYEEGIMAGV